MTASSTGNHATHSAIIVDPRPGEQTARITGTGIEVFAVWQALQATGSLDQVREAFHWLTDEQLTAALTCAEAYPAAVAARAAAEDEDVIAERLRRLWAQYPATAPTPR
jgi:uncharacterized protein (DUF433 family)